MRNLVIALGPAKVTGALRDVSTELQIEADRAPRAGELAASADAQRKTIAPVWEVWQEADAQVRVWNRRVVRADKAVKKATTQVSKVLDTHRDEPGVAEVIPLAFPVSASEGTAGLADEKQALFVLVVIEQVRAAPGMPRKVMQRVEELETAKATLDSALVKRQAARQAEAKAKAKLDQVLAETCAFYNDLYFDVGKLLGKEAAEGVFGR